MSRPAARRPRRLALAALAAAPLLVAAPPPAHAIFGIGDIVFDPAAYANLVQQLQQAIQTFRVIQQTFKVAQQQYNQLVTTYNALSGVRDPGQALIALGQIPGIRNPLPAAAIDVQNLISGNAVGGSLGNVASLFNGAVGNNGWILPPVVDWHTQQMNQTASGAAGVQAMAQQHYQAGADRLAQLANLRSRLATASDPKEIMDIQAQIQGVSIELQSQQQQAQAFAAMADVQPRIEEQRDEQYEYSCITQLIAYFNRTSSTQACPAAPLTGGTGPTGLLAGGSSDILGGGATVQPAIYETAVGATDDSNPFDAAGVATNGTDPTALIPPSATDPTSLDGTGDTPLGAGSGTDITTPTSSSGNDALSTLESQPYGAAAVQAAQNAGVNPATLASYGQIESHFQNTSNGSAVGVWQMIPATYQADAQAAGVPTDLSGRSDPATEAAAASQEIAQDASLLQNAGIANPTGLQLRGAYNFGPGYAVPLAQAPDSTLMSSVLSGMSANALQVNGISQTETVGQWRQGVVNTGGPGILQPALLSSTTPT